MSRPRTPGQVSPAPERAVTLTLAPDGTLLLPGDGDAGVDIPLQSPLRTPVLSYLDSLAPRSQQAVRERLRAVARLAGVDAATFPWHQLRAPHVEYIRNQMARSAAAPASINLTLAALRGVLRYARAYNLIGEEEYRQVCAIRPARGSRLPAGRDVAPGELSALVAACARDRTAAGARDAAILAVLYVGGLRRAELAALRAEHYTPDPATLRIMHGKGDKERLVPLTSSADAALRAWLDLRGRHEGPLFVPINKGGRIGRASTALTPHAIYAILARRAGEAGVAHVSPHDLRRTFVVICTNCGHHNVVDRQRVIAGGLVIPEYLEHDVESE